MKIIRFTPCGDITAYEVAQILPIILYSNTKSFFDVEKEFALLSDELKRHFTIEEKSEQVADQLQGEAQAQKPYRKVALWRVGRWFV